MNGYGCIFLVLRVECFFKKHFLFFLSEFFSFHASGFFRSRFIDGPTPVAIIVINPLYPLLPANTVGNNRDKSLHLYKSEHRSITRDASHRKIFADKMLSFDFGLHCRVRNKFFLTRSTDGRRRTSKNQVSHAQPLRQGAKNRAFYS